MLNDIYEFIVTEMPWINVDGTVYDLELEKTVSKQQALSRIRSTLANVKSKETFITTLFDTYPSVMNKYGITKDMLHTEDGK